MTQQDIHDFMTANFTCTNGLEHSIGQSALDSGHGARPVGPQICIRCRKTLAELLRQLTLEARRDELNSVVLNWNNLNSYAVDKRLDEINNQLSKDKGQ